MWANESVFYQIYPLGFCGAPFENDGIAENRIKKAIDWIPHMKKLGINAIYFSPIFESDTHGYNTRDFFKIDTRLGCNDDFKEVCQQLKKEGIKVVLDGVFNHVGRGFWAFQDVLEKRWDSPYKDWFHISFDGNSSYNDGLWYEGWEGNYDLVKLNLQNNEVVEHLLKAVSFWIKEFDIDGIRLDVAYCLDRGFMERLRSHCDHEKQDFFLVGEMLHGDYNQIMNDRMLHSVTNYECYKGIYSSFNSYNFFEILYSFKRQFGPEQWSLYRDKHLLCFADNHDVTRIATILDNKEHLPLVYSLLFGMPGIPCIYYGSEWGAQGNKAEGDPSLRKSYEAPEWNALTDHIAKLARLVKENKALSYGQYYEIFLTNKQCVFERRTNEEGIFVAINMDGSPFYANFHRDHGKVLDLLTEEEYQIENGFEMAPYRSYIFKEI